MALHTEPPPESPLEPDPVTGLRRRPPGWWLGWAPWVLAAAFACCGVGLLARATSLYRQLQEARRQQVADRRTIAELRAQLTAATQQAQRDASNFQARLAELERLALEKVAEAERHQRALQDQLQRKTTEWEQERQTFRRQLAAQTADNQALQDAVAKLTADNRQRLTQIELLVLQPVAAAAQLRPPPLGAVAWDGPQQRGLALIENLRPPPPGQDHQLWLHDPKYPIPISAGLLPRPASGPVRHPFKPLFPIQHLTKVTLTLETQGGTDKPQGPVLLESP